MELFIGGVQSLIMFLIVISVLLIQVFAIIDILRNEFTGNNKLIWVLVVLLFPILGAILYFVIGVSQKVK